MIIRTTWLLLLLFLLSSVKKISGTDDDNCKPPNYFKCKRSDRCISISFICDGEVDCGDGDVSDEESCDNYKHKIDIQTCKDTEFKCNDGNCILKEWVCDHSNDCPDGSDEQANCQKDCMANDEFKCKNGECIHKAWHCDGASDCSDGSDELDCPMWAKSIENCKLNENWFLCQDHSKCISLNVVCDGHKDCNDGSDEGPNCSNDPKCEECKHTCVKLPNRTECVCPPGMHGVDCYDINECETFGYCDQKCENSKGSFICSCHEGYVMEDKICRVNGSEGVLLYATMNEIRSYFLKSELYFPVATQVGVPTGVAYDGVSVYWATVQDGEESIYKSDIVGTNKQQIFTSGLGLVEDMAVDWITKNLYFTDSMRTHVAVCTNDARYCTALISEGIEKPRAIALDSPKGILYFSDWGQEAHISKSGMDGSEIKVVVNENLGWPNGISLDLGNERIYWADAHFDKVESAKFDGSDRRVVQGLNMLHPFSIEVFEHLIYWSDIATKEVLACNKFTGKSCRVIAKHKDLIYGIHIYHPVLLGKNEVNPCASNPCSHLCLLAPKKGTNLQYTCSCPDHMVLSESKHTCTAIEKPVGLAIASGSSLTLIDFTSFGKLNIENSSILASNIGAITYDSIEGQLILSDLYDGSFVMFDPVSKQHTKLIFDEKVIVHNMDFDPKGKNIYCVNRDKKSLQVVNLKNFQMVTLIADLGQDVPIDIAVVPEEGMFYMVLQNTIRTHIDRFTMDGSLETRIHQVEDELIGPHISLLYDRASHFIFFSDLGTGSIKALSVETHSIHEIKSMIPSPEDLAIIGSNVFWLNYASSKLNWCNFNIPSKTTKVIEIEQMSRKDNNRLVTFGKILAGEKHQCQIDNGGCSHLCLAMGEKKLCMCPDGLELGTSDKLNCISTECQDDEFKCLNKACIQSELRCNGANDCSDGSDEENCEYFKARCEINQFSCLDGKQCIESHKVCDHVEDCFDNSDEMDCHQKQKCSEGSEFLCDSGECILKVFQCDSKVDCEDKSDEIGCASNKCDDLEFRCSDGNCLPNTWECDGEVDCSDASDEHDKCVPKCEKPNFSCNNSRCIDSALVCNGENDCEDFSDESHCLQASVQIVAKNETIGCEQYQCPSESTICVPHEAICNGTVECPRGEDEQGCAGCAVNEFKCSLSRKCISKLWVCDNINDCGDNSDERNCKETHNNDYKQDETCDGLRCKSTGECIEWANVCNNETDCIDQSDEGGKCGHACLSAGCAHKCHETPFGYKCSCPSGYKLKTDGLSCIDVDECQQNMCSQYCVNTAGSYSCSCLEPHYRLRKDRLSCKANGLEMKYIFATLEEIRIKDKSFSKLDLFKFDREQVVNGLDVDMANNIIYWSSAHRGIVTRVSIEDNSVKSTITLRLVKPTTISVDWNTENLYIVENGNTIRVCNFKSQSCATIYKTNNENTIDALRIEPLKRLMFWSESLSMMSRDQKSIIRRSDLGGKGAVTIIDKNVKKVGDIAIDTIHQVIFWTDSAAKRIDKASFDGKERKNLFKSLTAPSNIDIFEDQIYWVNENSMVQDPSPNANLVIRCYLYGANYQQCSHLRLLPGNTVEKLQKFRISQPSLQIREKSNECENLGCSYICIPNLAGSTCICEEGSVEKNGHCRVSKGTEFSFEIEKTSIKSDNASQLNLWLITSILIMLLIASVVYVCYTDYCKNRIPKRLPSVHFHNPGFGLLSNRSTPKENYLNPGEHQYENPILINDYPKRNENDNKWSSNEDKTPIISNDYTAIVNEL